MAKRTLLLADDSITIQKVIKLTFADEGIDVVTVGDGDTAVQRIAEVQPDIVLADVNMPGLNGYQVCERVKSTDSTRRIPVLLLIGTFEQFDEAEADRVGADARLTKPFHSIRQLVELVTELMESSSRGPQVDRGYAPVPDTVVEPANESSPSGGVSTGTFSPTSPFDEPVTNDVADPGPSFGTAVEDAGPAETSPSVDLTPETPGSEPEDIDRLYRQSIGTESLPDDEELPDLGIDDEMIETSYTAPLPEADVFELMQPSDGQTEEYFDDSPSEGIDDLPEAAARSRYETADLSADELPAQSPDTEPSSGNATERLDPSMVEERMAELNRQFDRSERPETPPSEGDPASVEDTVRMDSRFDVQSSPSVEFDDVDLLDIPDGAELEIVTPAEAASSSSPRQIVTLSPELIEMIAQRVVEKLTDRY